MEPNWTRRQLLGTAGTGVCLGTIVSSDSLSQMLAQQASAATVEQGNWPQFGHDAANRGYNPGTRGPERNAEVDWVYEPSVEGAIESPVVASGSVYIVPGEQVIALDEEDGTEQWTYDELSSPTSPGVVDISDSDTELVCVGHSGGLLALNAKTGEKVWEIQTESRVTSSPTVSDQIVYVGDRRGWYYQIDAAAGERLWQMAEGGSGTCAAGENSIWFQSNVSIRVIFINRATEDFEDTSWADTATLLAQADDRLSFRFDSTYLRKHGAPMITNGTVHIPGLGVQAVDIEDGSEKWHFDDNIAVPSSPATDGERLYFGSGTEVVDTDSIDGAEENAGTLYALNSEEVTVEWTFDADGPINTSPAATVRTVYVTSDDGTAHALSVFTGEEAWSHDVGDGVGNPVVANNRLFVGSEENGLVALVESEGSATPTRTPTETSSEDNSDNDTDGSSETDNSDGEGDSDRDTDGNETNSGDDGSDGLGPGFGVGTTLAGLGGTSYLLGRRFESDEG